MLLDILEEENKDHLEFIEKSDRDNEIVDETKSSSFSKRKTYYNSKIRKEPYLPIAIFVESTYPNEIKEEILKFIDKLLSKGYIVRINGDDKEFIDKLTSFNSENIEIYIPWKGFNSIDSKFYFNNDVFKNIAKSNFLGWEKIPDTVKAMLARNVRMILGNSNNSASICTLIFTNDGVSKKINVTKETGKLSFVINLCDKYGLTLLNLKNKNHVEAFVRTFLS